MVDDATLERLSANESNEYQKYKNQFIQALLNSDIESGKAFNETYSIFSDGNYFFLSTAQDQAAFADIHCEYKNSIETLLKDAIQNYGR